MYLKDSLTNESLSKRMPSSYELVNYAIRLAKNMVEVERDARVSTPGIINSAYLILEEISHGKDAFEEPQPKVAPQPLFEETSEEKKPRRKLLKTLRTTKPVEKEVEIDMAADDDDDEDDGN